VRFALVDQAKEEFPVQRLCDVLGVSQSGYFAWKSRPASERQHLDMVLLAHVRSSFALSNGPLTRFRGFDPRIIDFRTNGSK
jgi:putative transposase